MSVPATADLQAGIDALADRLDRLESTLEGIEGVMDSLVEFSAVSLEFAHVVRDAICVSGKDTDDR